MPSKTSKDPAFLFYPGDASEDTQFMNRLERGCYFDILKAQKKFRRFNLNLIKKVLGNDFQMCWPALESVLRKEGDLYFIGWADDAIENRAAHAEKQKKRIKDYWDKKKSENIPEPIQKDTTEQPKQMSGNTLENEIENGDENEIVIETKGVRGEKRKSKLEIFEEIFTDELFVGDLSRMYPRKNLQEAFEQCWLWHIQKPSPPTEGWEWRQKLSTWLNSKQNGQGKSSHDSKSRIDEIIKNRVGSG